MVMCVAVGSGVAEASVEFVTGVKEGVAELFVAVAFADRLRAMRTPLLTDEYVVHIDVAGAG